MKQELWCKAGGHFWTREATRGRKPIACEEHRVATTPAPEPDCQYCVIQDDTLYGKGEDGRRIQLVNGPDFNPGDQGMAEKKEGRWYFVLFEAAPPQGIPPVPSPDPDIQTLMCKHGGGHLWTRPAQRGRKPEYCPDHRPQPVQSVREPGESDHAYRLRRRKEEADRRVERDRVTHQADMQAEFTTIDQRIEHADSEYQSALKNALKVSTSEMDRAFNVADRKQQSLINLLSRKRYLVKTMA